MDIEKTTSHNLKCSVCKNYLNVAPVLTSEDGKINKCGRCQLKGPVLNNRNSLYESIGAKLRFPCKNEECTDRMSWAEVQRHEKSCKHRKIECPFWNCREKDIKFVILNDISHFETNHPGSIHSGDNMTLNLKVITHHQSFMKLLVVDTIPFLMLIHCLKFGESLLIGLFNFNNKLYDYQLKIYSDKNSKRHSVFKENVLLYDEDQHCLYCLQNLCVMQNHVFSKRNPSSNQNEKYKFYSNIDVGATKTTLQTENLMIDVSIIEHQEQNGEK
ncbi:unnamed protein product [Phaedon cochleariae]|uniref:RING-type E3 ubiquitin transferase n=1 Tax=Phaedon cochleariae TaxID=80249 RepID=A0A9P0DIA0_PHACE|nr:unnamed protein product [Phaedon cochleariae]